MRARGGGDGRGRGAAEVHEGGVVRARRRVRRRARRGRGRQRWGRVRGAAVSRAPVSSRCDSGVRSPRISARERRGRGEGGSERAGGGREVGRRQKLRRVGGGKEKRGTARNAADGIREGRTRHLSARLLPCLFPDRVIHGVADLVQGFHGERRARARALTLPPARTPSLVFRRISLRRNARRAESRFVVVSDPTQR